LARTLELGCKLDLAEAITVGAIARKECRGSHYRLDYMTRDDQNWLNHTIYEYAPEGPRLSYRPVVPSIFPPEERKY
jgi:succinate dehydrogenase / fumarate reductase flavoprotein subunit